MKTPANVLAAIRLAASRTFFWSLCAVAFFIPLNPAASAWSLFVALLAWMACGSWRMRLPAQQSLLVFLPLILFYPLTLAAALWSDPLRSEFPVLRVQLPLIVLPVLFLFRPADFHPAEASRTMGKAFVAGNLVAFWLCIGNGFYRFAETGNIDVLSYGELVYWLFLHPAYSTLYAGAAFFILLSLGQPWPGWTRILYRTTLFCLVLFVFLLNSRGSMGAFLLIAPAYLFLSRFQRGRPGEFAVLSLLIFLAAVAITLSLPQNRERLFSTFDTKTVSIEEGTASLRLEIWRNAWSAIRQAPPWGVGSGEVRYALQSAYRESGFREGVQANFNTHQQYLQTALMLGVPGLSLLLWLFLQNITWLWKRRYLEWLAILCFFHGCMMTESMLERQMGALPFALCYALLLAIRADAEARQVERPDTGDQAESSLAPA